MPAPRDITRLIDQFERNADAYRSPGYNETQVRREFIDPFFGCLGWDIDNKQGFAEAYKDVIHEDAIKIGGATKAPDYCFRVGGTRKFFLEAKKPAVNVKQDPEPAYQLRRYAWSAGLPLSILTDFEEFAVYDCRVRPAFGDKASAGRTLYLTFHDYRERWEEIEGVFARDAVYKGSFDKYAEGTKAKRGTATVDTAFLEEIEKWRDLLARNFALRNAKLDQRELNYAVQVTIDRLLFLRMCEDRGIEQYGQLLGYANGDKIYPRLFQLFRAADDRYNSGLFYFHKEQGRSEPPDELTPSLKLDDKPLKDILHTLYYPESPYEFSVLPAEILGQVYEQFLGKVIRLTEGHQAKIEEKPEVRKAGGVYYTPTYIVDYIVKNTVGKLLGAPAPALTLTLTPEKAEQEQEQEKEKGKSRLTPRQAAKLRILDPACGSGSFLLGAYRYLLDWHRDWYVSDGPDKHSKEIYQGPGNVWRLTTAEKRRILLNNIYGVDIDPQAVETTKLSLLLKVLEGESKQTLEKQLLLFHERALPDLASNIKCGNSLIGPDFYDNQQGTLFDDEERYRINVFDWNAEFPAIMKAGGFDALIGNPPYVRIQNMQEWAPLEVEFYKDCYKAASKGNYDIYVVFVEKALHLLNRNARFGFILPHKFFNAKYGEPLRQAIAAGKHLSQIVHFGHQQIFEGATTYTCLLFLEKAAQNEFRMLMVDDLEKWRASAQAVQGMIPAAEASSNDWNFVLGAGRAIMTKLDGIATKLDNVADRIFQGIKTSADKIYIVNELETTQNRVRVFSPELESEHWLERTLLHPLIKGGDSRRYCLSQTERRILFPYDVQDGNASALINADRFNRDYPLTWAYLLRNKEYLENREHGKMRGPKWYGYVYPKALEVMPLPKIFTPDIAIRASFSLDATGESFFTGGVAGGYGILVKPDWNRSYVLGLLNSKLLEWYIRQTATQMRGGYFSFESRFIRHLPIEAGDSDRSRHDRVVALVEQMLTLHKQLAAAKTAHAKTALERQVAATDRQIDRLVYELYSLTEAEIKIVEEATAGG